MSAEWGAVGVCLEAGRRRTFASALEWPGWSRSGRDEEEALATLIAYAPRYAPVAEAAGLALPDPATLRVEERLLPSSGTDFGVPGAIAAAEREPLAAGEAERLVRLVQAAWAALDRIAAAAPAVLRKGPRGGGRDRDAILEHVVGAEVEAYAPKIGLRLRRPAPGDSAALEAQRAALVAALLSPSPPGAGGSFWPPRYAARRIAWHLMDHAWEMEDRAHP